MVNEREIDRVVGELLNLMDESEAAAIDHALLVSARDQATDLSARRRFSATIATMRARRERHRSILESAVTSLAYKANAIVVRVLGRT